MTAPSRPKRVVIVDADNPLVEVQGEFFWREDHEAILAAEREQAFRSGYRAGCDDAAIHARQQATIVRWRRPLLSRIRRAILAILLVVWLVIIVITIGEQLLNQH